ncbi:zinc-type alcohol dehydrogenase-like protein [Variibacter gotjawalensis]|uniref:Zinc-type alcohol dehydrogenase-like protein n=1 Tax=Variibacter gotjawalensis TaxID=1333996 RepID=A0A0S3PS27_9BRAD|nr:zinc-binding alcohol dehydrogenase family protein [Variibacter gotjawalensis]NIK49011.1 zinc-binding alcohol dehydrogenase family protein [Variibacter gotjawalensis]RZS50867.1 zinc-binding alcohol dehydrogenase family protein [Variibacter gotjawalensis]BAT58701.1 zinc-type alcohol dehydrogenase-like protein [Variibacter gotjawalensis]
MRAVAYQKSLPITDANSLLDIDLPKPEPKGRDLLVEVRAISVNPVDTKVRMRAQPPAGEYKVLGWDAAGVVVAAGPDAKLFKAGDEVWYAGDISRQGTNAEFHLVDERIVGPKPKSLDFATAAALPLTSITAYEMLFDRLDVRRKVPGGANAILIIGGAGGVGSIAIQLARKLTDLTIIASASRPETQDWVKKLGAHHVVDHRKPIAEQVKSLGIGEPSFVFSTTNSEQHIKEAAALIVPQGRYGLIDDPKQLDVSVLKGKSLSLHWEAMFARALFKTADIEAQHRLLTEVASLVDKGEIVSTVSENFGTINAANLKKAHALIESGTAKGKVVLAGF